MDAEILQRMGFEPMRISTVELETTSLTARTSLCDREDSVLLELGHLCMTDLTLFIAPPRIELSFQASKACVLNQLYYRAIGVTTA